MTPNYRKKIPIKYLVPTVLLIHGLTKGDWFDAALFALAVAVGLTSEMLPRIVSSNLAKGAIAMSKKKVIVKRLNAIQNFGAMDVLCTDKRNIDPRQNYSPALFRYRGQERCLCTSLGLAKQLSSKRD